MFNNLVILYKLSSDSRISFCNDVYKIRILCVTEWLPFHQNLYNKILKEF